MNLILSRRLNLANMGLLAVLLAPEARADVQIDPPRPLRIVTTEGESSRVLASRLDRHGIHGTDGLVAWEKVRIEVASKLWLSLMDRSRGEDWLDGAWIILVHPGTSRQDQRTAERFLKEASHRLANGPAKVKSLREAAAAHLAAINLAEDRQHEEELQRLGPEARSWPATPWQASGEDDEARRLHDVRGWMIARLGESGRGVGVDTGTGSFFNISGHALISSDEPREDLLDIGLELDRLVRELNSTFGMDRNYRPFAPRAGLLIFSDTTNLERTATKVLDRPVEDAMFQPIGSDGSDVILCVNGQDIEASKPSMRHAIVHAWLHRYRSPRRMPPWFNEGLANAIAFWRVQPLQQPLRTEAVAYLRTPGAAETLVDRPYAESTWALDGVDTAAAGLLVRRLLEERREQVVAWINKVKAGSPAETAFQEAMGIPLEEAISRQVRYWELND